MLIAVERLAKRELVNNNEPISFFSSVTSIVFLKKDRFPHNFKASMQVDLLGYKGMNLGSTTSTYK